MGLDSLPTTLSPLAEPPCHSVPCLGSQGLGWLLQVCGTKPGTPQGMTHHCRRNTKSAPASPGHSCSWAKDARLVTCSLRSLLHPLLLPLASGPGLLSWSLTSLSRCTPSPALEAKPWDERQRSYTALPRQRLSSTRSGPAEESGPCFRCLA